MTFPLRCRDAATGSARRLLIAFIAPFLQTAAHVVPNRRGSRAAATPGLSWLHLPAAIWGAIVEYTGWICPLTPIEHTLRAMAGESAYGSDFIGHYLLPLMYPAGLTRPVQMLLGTAVVLVNVTIYWLVFGKPPRRRQ